MILSNKELETRIIKDEKAIAWWEDGDWDKIKNYILIYPFKSERLSVGSYDLSVGEEYVSLRDPHNVRKLEEGKVIDIESMEVKHSLTKKDTPFIGRVLMHYRLVTF